jgi:GTP-binding protein
MKVVSAELFRPPGDKRAYPRDGLPEIAFAGRSNVGKSSMINALLGRNTLVRTSKTPGCTRRLSFLLVNRSLMFVDLPGYGYAAVPVAVKNAWRPMIEEYLINREELAGVVVLFDSRMDPTQHDREMVNFLIHHGISFVLVGTKADKVSRSDLGRRKQRIATDLGEESRVVFFSSRNGLGKNELWKEIRNLIE